ncbi:MAG: beta-galactosidase [Pseudomonadota bacterium]
MKRKLGVCYYPEHWPEALWADDARKMVDLGISIVRIGEFAWSRLEPSPGIFQFEWLDRAVETLSGAGLSIVLGTPSATPPRWMLDRFTDMLAVDQNGRKKGFGSRRHYCLAHTGYRDAAADMAGFIAARYADNKSIIAWQIDNEYGCHDTTLSWSNAAKIGFSKWLEERYCSVDVLNAAWGNVFWSMEYSAFDEIPLPGQAVTECNPAHWMAFRRYFSDLTVAFNRAQADAIRKHDPNAVLTHNFMGRVLDFDHFDVGADIDIAAWDSYPLGFLEDRSDHSEEFKRRFARQGDPDFQAFHHDLYRAVGKGRWWLMEQQPGPVNWAPHNPAPLPGTVRLWSWEAFAHGAETVSFFRWRQAPFAQEQLHAGLLRPDNSEAMGFSEATEVSDDLGDAPDVEKPDASVAIVFDYQSAWAWDIQPQGKEFDYFRLVYDTYRALRRHGLTIDVVSSRSPILDGYKAVFIPGLFAWNGALLKALSETSAYVVIGPRTGSKTDEFSIPDVLPPSCDFLFSGLSVTEVETLRADCPIPIKGGGSVQFWHEFLEIPTGSSATFETETGEPILIENKNLAYLGGWLDDTGMDRLITHMADTIGLRIISLEEGVRITDTSDHRYVFNYGAKRETISKEITGVDAAEIPPAGILRLQRPSV